MTQEQKQEFTRRISQENHSGLILVLCDIFHTYGMDAMAAYEAENMTTYLQSATPVWKKRRGTAGTVPEKSKRTEG